MEVILDKAAFKTLDRLNEPLKSRIKAALVKLSAEPPQGDIKKLQGEESAYRIRVGDYRILYKDKGICYAVYKIAPRGEAYKD